MKRIIQDIGLLAVLTVLLVLAVPGQAAPVKLPNGNTVEKVDFERHIIGLLGRLGCSSGSCHGSFQGKGGLYMSLFGYSPEKDYISFTREGLGRRINLVDPDKSLLLLKATGQLVHGGGRLFDKNSYQYKIFREWIADGARWEKGSGDVARMEVTPKEHQFTKPGENHQLLVVVKFADNTVADMSYFSEFRVNDDYVAEVSKNGMITGHRPGDTAVVVSYRGNVRGVRTMVPVEVSKGFKYPKVPEVNYVDREVFAKLKKLNIVPSELAGDTEFLRRVYIDTIGRLPQPEEIRQFQADKDSRKREKLIDKLLAHPMHAALWATKMCDITGNNTDNFNLSSRNLFPKYSKMWHDWFRVRFEKNVPYDQIVEGVFCATSDDGMQTNQWVSRDIKYIESANKGFDTDYAKKKSLDLFWKRKNFGVQQMAEHTAAAFMGVRVECAQCHKHPFDRWTQADYSNYSTMFQAVRVGTPRDKNIKKAIDQANRNKTVRKVKEKLRAVYIEGNRVKKFTALGGPEFEVKTGDDPRVAMFNWLKLPDNPYFARSFVNRIWAQYFGIGIVDPVDDFAIANPPSNPKLLDELAQDFIKSKFDIRRIERAILMSRAYQLSAKPNESNIHDRNNFSRSFPRRMIAEVMLDVLNGSLGVTENFGKDVPKDARAIEVAPSRVQSSNVDYIFRIFGRPPRSTSCDCERGMEAALPQTLFLMTDSNLINKINNGRLKKLIADKNMNDEKIVEELFLATLCRLPKEKEKAAALANVEKKGRQPGLVDVTWALINTREFILNH